MTVATPVPLVFGDYTLEDRYRLDKGRVYMPPSISSVSLRV